MLRRAARGAARSETRERRAGARGRLPRARQQSLQGGNGTILSLHLSLFSSSSLKCLSYVAGKVEISYYIQVLSSLNLARAVEFLNKKIELRMMKRRLEKEIYCKIYILHGLPTASLYFETVDLVKKYNCLTIREVRTIY